MRVAVTLTGPGVGPKWITALDKPDPSEWPPLLTLVTLASPSAIVHVIGTLACGELPSSASTTSGLATVVLVKPDWPSPETITSDGRMIVMVKDTVAPGLSLRVPVTTTGPGPEPTLRMWTLVIPVALVKVCGELSVAPPLALQLIATPAALVLSFAACTTNGCASGALAAADWPSPLTPVSERATGAAMGCS